MAEFIVIFLLLIKIIRFLSRRESKQFWGQSLGLVSLVILLHLDELAHFGVKVPLLVANLLHPVFLDEGAVYSLGIVIWNFCDVGSSCNGVAFLVDEADEFPPLMVGDLYVLANHGSKQIDGVHSLLLRSKNKLLSSITQSVVNLRFNLSDKTKEQL